MTSHALYELTMANNNFKFMLFIIVAILLSFFVITRVCSIKVLLKGLFDSCGMLVNFFARAGNEKAAVFPEPKRAHWPYGFA